MLMSSPVLFGCATQSVVAGLRIRVQHELATVTPKWRWLARITMIFQCFEQKPGRRLAVLLQKGARRFKRRHPERWPSGLRRTLGKRVCGKLYRGFESHSLRQKLVSANFIQLQFLTQLPVIPASYAGFGVPLNSILSRQISRLSVCKSVCSWMPVYGAGV